MADKTPNNAGKSTTGGGDDKPSSQNTTPTTPTPVVSDAGSSSSLPPPPPPPPPAAAAASVPTIAAATTGGRVVNSSLTTPPPAPPSAAATFRRVLPISTTTPRSLITPPHAPRIATNAGIAGGSSATAPTPIMVTPSSRHATAATPTNAGSAGNVLGQTGGGTSGNRTTGGSGSSIIMYTPAGGSRKRSRADNEVGGSPSRPRFNGPADMMGIPPPCWVCGRQFGSWKALFGHMRSHPERQWRGVFPPPTFRIEGSPPEKASEGQQPGGTNVKNKAAIHGETSKKSENDLASTLLELAKGCLNKISGVGTSSAQERIVLDIDLNLAWQPVMEEEPVPPPVTTSSPPPPPPPPSPPQPQQQQRSPTPPPPPPSPPSPPPRGDAAAGGIPDLNHSPPQNP